MNSQPDAAPTAEFPRPGATPGFQLRHASGTDRGLRREVNEDAFLAADPVFCVADGMGGHQAGEVASALCISALAAAPQLAAGDRTATAAVVQQCLYAADDSIRAETGSQAGTTLSGVVVVEHLAAEHWLVFNIGDARTYRLNSGGLAQLTVDHSEVQDLVDTGQISPAEAAVHPRRHVVTRALGAGDAAEADYWLVPIQDGDRILVCSDGLNGELSDEDIARILAAEAEPQAAVDELIAAALARGGRDNVTAVVVDARMSQA